MRGRVPNVASCAKADEPSRKTNPHTVAPFPYILPLKAAGWRKQAKRRYTGEAIFTGSIIMTISLLRPSALATAALIFISGCAHQTNAPNTHASQATAIDELFAADRAFSTRSGEIGAGAAFVEFASEEVRAFPGGRVPLKGKEALAEWTGGWSPERAIAWEPEEAFVSASGDFGYTWGYATFTRPNKEGKGEEEGGVTVTHGKYVTIWRRQPDGEWKWIADLGNSAPPPEER